MIPVTTDCGADNSWSDYKYLFSAVLITIVPQFVSGDILHSLKVTASLSVTVTSASSTSSMGTFSCSSPLAVLASSSIIIRLSVMYSADYITPVGGLMLAW